MNLRFSLFSFIFILENSSLSTLHIVKIEIYRKFMVILYNKM